MADIAASFQCAVLDVLVTKTIRAAEELSVGQILLSGGVAAHKLLAGRFLSSLPIL
ncbi:MAG: tRNA (adenosine(37)-N6)-threonylcarbamoyltransferase complex transferase subunit TsaD, partial [Dehalococcoidia bacterium]|nr:tRNA (adenosine(37)-N6)-threonylcarbamoyltransferase complex transferase subunit TsaD [Dehalococcoidia bacterium]